MSGRRFPNTVDDIQTSSCRPLRQFRILPESFRYFRTASICHKCLSQYTSVVDNKMSTERFILLHWSLMVAFLLDKQKN